MEAVKLAQAYRGAMVKDRRWIHQHAELSMKEVETTKYIRSELDALGVPCLTPHTTGAIGVIKGKLPGKTIGLRAELDALPIQEQNDVVYRSINDGVMHACGHDAHAASLLGAARILMDRRDELHGTVKLIFQPSEEGHESGALAMMSAGDLDDCAAFAAVHANSDMPVGTVSVEEGPRMAASSGFYVTINGSGGHGGRPWETIDPVMAAAAVIMNLQPLLTRELDRHHMVVASVGLLRGGTRKNMIPDSVYMEGTLRFYEPEIEELLREKITRIIEHTCIAYRATADVRVSESFPAVINAPKLSALARGTAAGIWGEDGIIHQPSSTGNDDFAFYSRIAPLLYVNVGTANMEKACDYPHHHPSFDVDEDALVYAAAFFAQYALDFLGKE